MQVIQSDVIKCCKMMSSNVVLLHSNNCCVVLKPAICEDLDLHITIFIIIIMEKNALAQKYFESNRCTKYYFGQLGKHNDSLKSLTDPDSQAVTDNSKILLRCKLYYQELYHKPYLFSDLNVKDKFLSLVPHNVL